MSRSAGLPEKLVTAVGEAVRDSGAGAVSLRAVARRAGVSHAAPAHHFKNKAGMMSAFAADGFRRLATSVTEEIESSLVENGADELAAVGRGYVRFATSHPEFFEVMFRVDALDLEASGLVEATEAAYLQLLSAVSRCAQEGLLGERDPIVVGVAAWSMVHGFSSLWIGGWLPERTGETDPARLSGAVSRLFVDFVLGG